MLIQMFSNYGDAKFKLCDSDIKNLLDKGEQVLLLEKGINKLMFSPEFRKNLLDNFAINNKLFIIIPDEIKEECYISNKHKHSLELKDELEKTRSNLKLDTIVLKQGGN